MPAAADEETTNRFILENIIFDGGTTAAASAGNAAVAAYDPEETPSQYARTPVAYDQAVVQDTFMRDQVGLDLDGFPLDHEFPEDYAASRKRMSWTSTGAFVRDRGRQTSH